MSQNCAKINRKIKCIRLVSLSPLDLEYFIFFEGCGGYCWLYNVVNYPAGVLPVTRVTNDDVTNLDKYPSKTTMERLVKKVRKEIQG